MNKAFLTLTVLCGIGLMSACKNATTNEPDSDTVAEIINQYDADGQKDGLWRYNEGDIMITDVHYRNGIECGELKMFYDGKLDCHITDIVKVDTVIVSHVVRDTIYQTTNPHKPVRPRPITAKTSRPAPSEKIGVSMLEDGIRYDVLAQNRDMQMY